MSKPKQATPIKLLLIDDDEDEFVLHRDLLAEVSGSRYLLDWAPSYEEGLAALKADRYDAYLIDYRLGEKTGIELLRTMQSDGIERAMIVLTGQNDDEIDLSAMESGASDYLVKGEVNAATLERAIRYAIEHRRILSRLRFQAEILGNVHDAVFYVTGDGVVRNWNEGAARIFAISSSEAIGRTLMEICPPADGHAYTDRIVSAIRKNSVAEEVIHCRLRSGRDIYIRAKVTPMLRQGEEGYVFCASDITKEKRLEAELVRISENEQRRIGQDIHDDLCSQLSGIGCLTKVLEHRLNEIHAEEAAMVAGITEMVAQAGTKAREIAKGLVPTVLETQGLAGALREMALRKREMVGVSCVAAVSDEDQIEKLPESISIQLYRIAQEAVTNAIKHSDADVIEMSLRAHDGRLELRIRDDGKGMPRDQVSTGMGLLTMRRRAELIGADFSIQASPGGGAYIRCIVPLLNHE